MTVSGLLIFLPILSAFVGAIIGAWANSWYRNREAKKAEDREREGLLRIIDAEVYENNRLLKDMIAEPHIADKYPSRTALNTAVWDDSRTKLSQLLATDQEHIVHLTRHYAVVGRIRAPLGDPDAPISARNKRERQARTANIREKRYILLSQLANLGYLDGEQIRRKGGQYIGELPDYYPTSEEDPQDEQAADGEGQDTRSEDRSTNAPEDA